MTAEAIASLGTPGVLVHGVNVRPGKPTILAVCDGKAVIGLPGNPVSAMVSFDVFARPAILKMAGRPLQTAMAEAEVAADLSSDGRQSYIRVRLERVDGKLIAHSTGS